MTELAFKGVKLVFDEPAEEDRLFFVNASWARMWQQVVARGYITRKYARGRHGRTNQYLRHK